ncbi:MAG TPA: metal-dependent hydrolase [Alphaproteobacteria bacterium]|nr:metal-dependent hydrolase [Alphaproteobacteria bacterium]
MAYAVTHVIIAIVLIDLYRDYIARKKFSTWYVLIGGIAGLLPDIDFPVQIIVRAITGTDVIIHRTYTHSMIYVGIFLLFALIFHLWKNKTFRLFKKKISTKDIALFFVIVAAGWFIHLALDCTFSGEDSLTWIPGTPLGFCTNRFSEELTMGIDAIILVLWLFHEQWKHKIKDYI